MRGYRKDLAYVHDAGFRGYALNAVPGLLSILRENDVRQGLIIDLGCGSGRWAAELNRAGYQVIGVDQSRPMIELARRIAPAAEFRIDSLLSAKLVSCDGITSIGECFNYCFDARNSLGALGRLFRRVYRALRPGGVFVFDIAEPERLPRKPMPHKSWFEGEDWTILVSVDGDRKRRILRREIICLRKVGMFFRRSQELHTLRLYPARDLLKELAQCGFEARRIAGYGRFRFPAGIAGIVARKP